MAVAAVTQTRVIQTTADSSFFSGKVVKTNDIRVRTVTRTIPVVPPQSTRPLSGTATSPPSNPTPLPPSPSKPPKRKPSEETSVPQKRQKLSDGSSRKHKNRVRGSSKASSRHSSRPAASPPPVYRLSTSSNHKEEYVVEKRDWAAPPTLDPNPFSKACSSYSAVEGLLKKYQSYFKDPSDPSSDKFTLSGKELPTVTLNYPARGASETFILAAPKDKDHYNPFFDFEKSMYTIVEHYVPARWRHWFGHIPDTDLTDAEDESEDEIVPCPPMPCSRLSSPDIDASSLYSHASSCSRSSSVDLIAVSRTPSSHSYCRGDRLTPGQIEVRKSTSPFPPMMKKTRPLPVQQRPQLLRAVARAIHLRDGPGLLKAVEDVNDLILQIREPVLPIGPRPFYHFDHAVSSWSESGLPRAVLMRILEENYQRSVGPHVLKLKQYPAFSSSVYGELMPDLVHEILIKTKVRQNSLFMDLGSGVGNIVVQAALQTGCRAFGVELNDAPAQVAANMVEPFKTRCRMWGLGCGDIELVQGDMLTHPRVDELIKEVDVVLVDNKVFDQRLNESLKPKFLDLKEGAIVVSLAPFVTSINNGRLTERNLDDMANIFHVTEHEYHSGSVSWGNGGGHYYIHRVDREGLARFRQQIESQRRSRRR